MLIRLFLILHHEYLLLNQKINHVKNKRMVFENMNNINKPITVQQTELIQKIIEDINESNLHPIIVVPIINEVLLIAQKSLENIREKEKNEYEKMLSVSDNKDDLKNE